MARGTFLHRVMRTLAATTLLLLVATALAPAAFADGAQGAAGVVGAFEVDGNSPDDSGAGDPIDWATPPPNQTPFTDLSKSKNDESFGQGSKELEPGGWKCTSGGVPGKDDIVEGAIAFREVGGDQFLYARWRRLATNGDAHIDYEFNQSDAANPACTDTPQRTNGDILMTFDTENGGSTIIVRAFSWQFTGAGVGVFNELPVGSKHVSWDGSVNIAPEKSDAGVAAGAFGEFALNLTDTVGDVECGEFASAYMKTRASTAINAALKDRTQKKPVQLANCPDLDVTKTADEDTVTTGNDIGFTITVSNLGQSPALNTTLTDALPGGSAYGIDWSIDGGTGTSFCSITGSPPTETLECAFGDVPGGTSYTVHVSSPTSTPSDCQDATLPNTATADADNHDSVQASATITLQCPDLNATKVADDDTVSTGDPIGFTITVSNDGTGTAENTTLSDALPGGTAYGIDWSIDGGTGTSFCSITGSPPTETLACDFGDVPGGTSYTVHVSSPTSTPDDCQDAVLNNQATVDSDNHATVTPSATITLQCPDLVATKVADDDDVQAGTTIGFTITLSNQGTGTAHGVTLSDALPGSTQFGVNWSIDGGTGAPFCSITGSPPNETLTCNFGDIPGGTSYSIHLSSPTSQPAGPCVNQTLVNQATVNATNHATVTPSATIIVRCICIPGEPDPATGSASGGGVSAEVDSDDPLATAHAHVQHFGTSQSGPGSQVFDDRVAEVNLATNTVVANTLEVSSSSTVTSVPAGAVQLTMTRGQDVGVLCTDPNNLDTCEVSFTAGIAVARAEAGPYGASVSSAGTAAENLKLDGVPLDEIVPNTTVNLPEFGAGSHVTIYERTGGTSFIPDDPADPLTSGTYTADMHVILAHVYITDINPVLPGAQGPYDIRVLESSAHASFDRPTLCDPVDAQSVSGHAFLASLIDPLSAPGERTIVGNVELDPMGGMAHANLKEGTLEDGAGNVLLTYGGGVTHTEGSLDPGSSSATGSAEVGNVCIQLPAGSGCTVSANLVRSVANAFADGAGAEADDLGTVFLNLFVTGPGGIGGTPPPNTSVILPGGIGTVVLNEQECDDGSDPVANPTCQGPSGHAGRTVSAIHVMLIGGIDLIVSQAHADATFDSAV